MENTETPFVSIIMPIRNEADFIEKAITSILVNDYPANRFEVLIVDGMSTDRTREIVDAISKRDPRVKLLDNPQKIVPTGMNIGIRNAAGDIIIRVDGHTEVPDDFIIKNIEKLTNHNEAWCVGGHIINVSPNYVGKAIAAAMSSPFGVGNAMFRLGNFEGYVDTIAFGAYRRWVFDKIGMFDEELIRNQDDELNYRLIAAGGKILMSPEIRSTYYTRSSLKKLWRQYFQYGFWRIRTLQKHGRPATLRQTVPLMLVMSLLILFLGGFIWRPIWYLLWLELLLYTVLLVLGLADVSRRSGFKQGILAPLVFGILHFAYGLGSLWGIVRFILLKGFGIKSPADMKLSR